MDHVTHQLCRAFRIRTAYGRFSLFAGDRSAAGRTDLRNMVRFCLRGMGGYCNHFWDDLPRFAQNDRIPNTDVLFCNKVLIVQSRAADGSTCQRDRLKETGWSQDPCTAHIDLNFQQLCLFLLRRVLKSFRPFGKFRRTPQRYALRKIVHLDDRPINGISQ